MARQFLIAFVAAILDTVAFTAPAQAVSPEKPITVIVPFGAGGGSDTLTHHLIGERESCI